MTERVSFTRYLVEQQRDHGRIPPQLRLLLEVVARACKRIALAVNKGDLGDVMGNVSSRRGRVEGTEVRGQDQIIHAFVPLSEMFGYTTDLRSRTQGRGMFTMQFDHYEEVPKSVVEKIIGKKNVD